MGALHEAGHAVVAHALGARVERVSSQECEVRHWRGCDSLPVSHLAGPMADGHHEDAAAHAHTVTERFQADPAQMVHWTERASRLVAALGPEICAVAEAIERCGSLDRAGFLLALRTPRSI